MDKGEGARDEVLAEQHPQGVSENTPPRRWLEARQKAQLSPAMAPGPMRLGYSMHRWVRRLT